jgi:hypothetical protein
MEVNLGQSTDWVGLAITVLIAMAGWFIGYLASVRAQYKLLHAQQLNEARKEIVSAFRRQQNWILALTSVTHRIEWQYEIEQAGHGPINWLAIGDYSRRRIFANDFRWLLILEEHQALLPKTAICRRQLALRGRALAEMIQAIPHELLTAESREKLVRRLAKIRDWASDDRALSEDLIVYVQNVAFMATGHGEAVPFRVPLDPTLPRVVVREDGMLCIEPAATVPPEPRYEWNPKEGKVRQIE